MRGWALLAAAALIGPAGARRGGNRSVVSLVIGREGSDAFLRELEDAAELGVDIRGLRPPAEPNVTDLEVEATFTPASWSLLRRGAVRRWRVLVEDQDEAEAEERRRLTENSPWEPKQGFEAFFQDFRPYEEQLAFLDAVVQAHPGLVARARHGATVDGREIPAVRLSAAPAAQWRRLPLLYVQAGAHGREWTTSATALYLVHRIAEAHAAGHEGVRAALAGGVVYVVPNLNVDGYLFTWTTQRDWRKNRRDNGDGSFGVDLNRNWGPAENWCKGPPRSGITRSSQYCGKEPFSEPEVQAGRDFLAAHPGLRAVVDLHAFGPSVLWPFFYTKEALPEPALHAYERLGAAVSDAIHAVHGTAYPSSSGAEGLWYRHPGSLTDYAWAAHRARAFTFEDRGPTMAPPASSVLPTAEEQYAGLLRIAEEALAPHAPSAGELPTFRASTPHRRLLRPPRL